jgi:hypothetical protein
VSAPTPAEIHAQKRSQQDHRGQALLESL